MSERALQALIGHAIVDKRFRHQLMNGGREHLLVEFDLTEDERDVVRSIQAQTFEEFASQLHAWILRSQRSQNGASVRSRFHIPPRVLSAVLSRQPI